MEPMTLDTLRAQLTEWKGCDLAKNANPVLGEGNPEAKIVFIGEAPGQREDELKRPFVGASGQFLDELLGTIGLKREDVYITNVVKYRPPNNRDPTPEEKAQCMPWLQMELAIIKPRVIATLGRHSLGHFFPTKTITETHGKPQKLTDQLTVFPIYHPAAALHNGNLRASLYADFKALGEFLKSNDVL